MIQESFQKLVEAVDRGESVDARRRDILGLFVCIQQVGRELAAMRRPADAEHDLGKVGDQLRAIVEATEASAHAIMEAMENNDKLVGKLRETIRNPEQLQVVDEISRNGMAVFEACSFHDITGQRVRKIATALSYLEEKLNALVEIWGRSAIEAMEVGPSGPKTDDERLLEGPQPKGQGVNQAEIDKLFG